MIHTKRRKIALVKVAAEQVAWGIAPLGLLYVGGALRRAGYDVKIYHILPSEIAQAATEIAAEDPLFVGFSVLTGETIRACANMSRQLKATSKAAIVWGNAHPSLLPKQCVAEDYIDYVVVGEGEATAVELADALYEGADVSPIASLGFKQGGEPIVNPSRPFIKNLDDYPMDWGLIGDRMDRYLHNYWDRQRLIHTVSSRGCPYNCAFCYNAKFSRRKWRCHSADFTVEQIQWLQKRYGVDAVSFQDDEFFVRKDRAFEIVERLRLPYYCETKSKYVDEDFARRLSETDCRLVLMGMESGSDRILELINKGSTVGDNLRAARNLAQFTNVWISGSFMFGLPTETHAEYQETIDLILEMLKVKPEMNVTAGYYMPYPGSELYSQVQSMGFVPPSKTEDWEDLNRWQANFSITWVDWLTDRRALNAREYLILLTMLHRYHVPLLKRWVRWRVRSGSLNNAPDLKFLVWLRELLISSEGNGVLGKIASAIVRRRSQEAWGT